jgi:hypothetical protein
MRLGALGALAWVAVALSGCAAEGPSSAVLPTPHTPAAHVDEQPTIPDSLDAPEFPPYYAGARTLIQVTSEDDILSAGPFDDLGGGLVTVIDCAGAGTLTVSFGDSTSTTMPCDSTDEQPVQHYQNESVMDIGAFQLAIETTGEVVWGLSLATFSRGT